MFWHIVLLLLSPLASLIGLLMVDDRDREILALRQQVLILQRQLGKRPRLVRGESTALGLTGFRIEEQEAVQPIRVVWAVSRLVRLSERRLRCG